MSLLALLYANESDVIFIHFSSLFSIDISQVIMQLQIKFLIYLSTFLELRIELKLF